MSEHEPDPSLSELDEPPEHLSPLDVLGDSDPETFAELLPVVMRPGKEGHHLAMLDNPVIAAKVLALETPLAIELFITLAGPEHTGLIVLFHDAVLARIYVFPKEEYWGMFLPAARSLRGFAAFDLTQALKDWAQKHAAPQAQLNGLGTQRSSSTNRHVPLVSETWRTQLQGNQKTGQYYDTPANIGLILANHATWKGKFWMDSVGGRPMIGATPITDKFETEMMQWVGIHEHVNAKSYTNMRRCLLAECENQRRDLIQEWLQHLTDWDGVSRLSDWLRWVCKVETYAEEQALDYVQAVSRLLILGPVARALMPGCQYRYVVILQGAQNIGKSELVRAIGGEQWYGTLTHDLANKESLMMLQGSWICELEELHSFKGTALTRLKAFITSRNDIWVPKFGNYRVEVPRRTVLIGTTNEEEYFQDATGETRYLPISIHTVNLHHFAYMREQLFAEALVELEKHPDTWWKLSDAAEEQASFQREQRRQPSIYEDKLARWLETHIEVTMEEVLRDGIGVSEPSQWRDPTLQRQAGQAMRACGWKVRVTTAGKGHARKSVRRWIPA